MERREVFWASALLATVPSTRALGCSTSDSADESGDTATARSATESASTTSAASSTGTMTAQSSGGGAGQSGDTSDGGPSSTTGSVVVPPVDCRNDGDGRTTLVFVNRCAAAVTVRGSDIEDSSVASEDFFCVEIGSATEELPSKRYWGFVGADPGAEHHTLAEFTFNTDFNDFDWYNISHVDAFNLPMQIVPVDRPDCATLTCAEDLVAGCPAEGRFEDENGELLACVSPDRDNGESPVALYFESCADAYAWSGDDQHGDDPSPVRACAGEDWDIVFCPSGAE